MLRPIFSNVTTPSRPLPGAQCKQSLRRPISPASGLKRQDSDLIVIESSGAAAAFKRAFDARFANGKTLPSSAQP
jgi:hypothetical protein